MRPEVTIDARWLRTGLGTYTYNLVCRLRQFLGGCSLRGIVQRGSVDRMSRFCDAIEVVDTPIYTVREQLQIPWSARGSELLHIPHYNVPVLYRGRLVVTIHDLIHLMDAEQSKRTAVNAYANVMLRAAAHKAEQLITVSEFSKKQMIERLGLNPRKISVIPNGVGSQFHPGQSDGDGVIEGTKPGKPYFLYVGNFKSHKNLLRLLHAIALVQSRTKLDWTFTLVGPRDEHAMTNLLDRAKELHLSGTISFLTDTSDELLPEIYRRAQFLVFPSILEGFGLPVLEAMACGTPVICSRAASLPEVGGDAVRYFDPLEIEDIAEALEAVAASQDLRDELGKKGLIQAARFSWDESARRHAEVYKRCLSN